MSTPDRKPSSTEAYRSSLAIYDRITADHIRHLKTCPGRTGGDACDCGARELREHAAIVAAGRPT